VSALLRDVAAALVVDVRRNTGTLLVRLGEWVTP